jgi:hypothetical protein
MTINVPSKDPYSHLLFPIIKKENIHINEIVGVHLHEGRRIYGVVDEICSDGEHFWLRVAPSLDSHRERFSFKIDRIIKLN